MQKIRLPSGGIEYITTPEEKQSEIKIEALKENVLIEPDDYKKLTDEQVRELLYLIAKKIGLI